MIRRTKPLKKPAKKKAKVAKKATKAKSAKAAKAAKKAKVKSKVKAKVAAKPKAAPQPKRKAKKPARPLKAKAKTKKPAVRSAKKAKPAAKPKATAARKKAPAPVRISAAPPPAAKWPPLVESLLSKLDEAKAEAVIAIDLTGKSSVADTMVVASGRSNRHVDAIARQAIEELEKRGVKNIRSEGMPQCDWVLVDAGDILLHVFRPEVRSFYNLEKLWSAHAP